MANKITSYKRVPSQGDPRGQINIIDEDAIPGILSDEKKIFEYVQGKAEEIGLYVKKNRGMPSTAEGKHNMLSVEEKALIILGRATGVVWREVEDRLRQLREAKGLKPPTAEIWSMGIRTVKSHEPIVAAIQADMVEAMEAFSPLVNGSQRFVWRASILEGYRQRIMGLMSDLSLVGDEQEANDIWSEIRATDSAMKTHLSWMDQVAKSKSPLDAFNSPAQKAREQADAAAEAQIEKQFEAGEITDSERIERLRRLRHGGEE